jgi:SAM-dependent methyltransferase
MGDTDATDATYGFGSGIGDGEIARLEAQSRIFDPATRMIFTEAGLRPGMRVLDLGSGAGDTAFVAADLVGPGGSVTGVDHSPDALARARYRAGQRGLAQVQFIDGDVHDPAPGGPYDAIVERATLWTVPDPAEVLRRQVTVLRPGGLVVPVEPGFAPLYTEPELPLMAQLQAWQVQALTSAGSPLLSTGRRLWAIAEEAGLRPLGTLGIQLTYGPVDEAFLTATVEGTRNMMPLFVGTGVATAEEIGIETLEQRLRDEWEKNQAVIAQGALLSAWATTGPE